MGKLLVVGLLGIIILVFWVGWRPEAPPTALGIRAEERGFADEGLVALRGAAVALAPIATPAAAVAARATQVVEWSVEGPPPPLPGRRSVIAVVFPEHSLANVYVYNGSQLVQVLPAYSGGPGNETITGDFKALGRLGTIKTTLYRKTLGHEYVLRSFVQFQGDYGFHAYRINEATGREEPGPSRGCLALNPQDASWLHDWMEPGTPIRIVQSRG